MSLIFLYQCHCHGLGSPHPPSPLVSSDSSTEVGATGNNFLSKRIGKSALMFGQVFCEQKQTD